MSKAEAFDDFIQEIKKGVEIGLAAKEVAPFYSVNPDYLIRLFNTRYPDGLPDVDVKKAEMLAEKAEQSRIQQILSSNQALADFYNLNPSSLPRNNKGAMKVIRENQQQQDLIQGVRKALETWSSAYRDRNGVTYAASRLADVKSEMIRAGWRNVSRIDECDIRQMGFRIVEATYVGGVRPTGKFVNVVVSHEIEFKG